MKPIKMTAHCIAKMLFSEREQLPKATFCLHQNKNGEYEWACEVAVISIADSILCIGNYCGGGCPMCHDLSIDIDERDLARSIEDWVKSLECDMNNGPVVYLCTYDHGSKIKQKKCAKAIVEIEEGMLVQVYSDLEDLEVELVDRDVTGAKDLSEIDARMDEIRRGVKNGDLFTCW